MRAYEVMIIQDPTLEADDTEKVLDRVSQIIGDNGGSVTNVDRWGRRKLSYEIAGHQEGNYTVISFQGPPDIGAEVERYLRIVDAVIRFLVVKQGEK